MIGPVQILTFFNSGWDALDMVDAVNEIDTWLTRWYQNGAYLFTPVSYTHRDGQKWERVRNLEPGLDCLYCINPIGLHIDNITTLTPPPTREGLGAAHTSQSDGLITISLRQTT